MKFPGRERRRYIGGFYYRGDFRLRLRRITWFHDGLTPDHRQLRRWEVSWDRGIDIYTSGSRSFTWAVLKSLAGIYRRSWERWREGRRPQRS